MKLIVIISTLLSLIIFSPNSGFSESSEEKGLAIAQEDDKRDNGFNDFTASMIMNIEEPSRGGKFTVHQK